MESVPGTRRRPLPGAPVLARDVEDILRRRPAEVSSGPALRAAVLILLYDRAGEPHLVLTKRTDTLEHHPGQVSLPGGRWDPQDAHLGVTALRETHEELGIDPASIRLVGRMDDVPTAVSGFIISPFVGVSHLPLEPVPNEHEIARVLEVSVGSLLVADGALPEEPDILTLRYPLLGEDVWGATARVLRAFSAVVRAALGGVGVV